MRVNRKSVIKVTPIPMTVIVKPKARSFTFHPLGLFGARLHLPHRHRQKSPFSNQARHCNMPATQMEMVL